MAENFGKIRCRIAPSPTGSLHVGTARTALFNYLFARKYNGKFIIRIEDTDLERSDPKYEKSILEGLKWLDIEADEGPENGGQYGPYKQSGRLRSYVKYIQKLFADKKAFYCFHSEEELEKEKNNLLEAKKPPLHLCEYRNLDPKEAKELTEIKKDYIIRFKTPLGKKIIFNDLIRSEVSFESDLLGDFSIAKRPDAPLYNFAVVVDDYEMQITHVIRGEDHISNTPKQLLLIEALGFNRPQYAHLPLILGSDRSKLSKRHGAVSLEEYKEAGYLPEALLNFIALLGWNPGDEREIFSKKELIKEFSIEKIQKSGAVFDINKLDWMNGRYIRQKSTKELTKLCKPFLKNLIGGQKEQYIEKIVALERPRLKKLSEITRQVEYFFKEPRLEPSFLQWKNMTDKEIVQSLDTAIELLQENKNKNTKTIKKIFLDMAYRRGDGGTLLWPLRMALSGKKASPGPFEIMDILGVEESIKRLQKAEKTMYAKIK